MLSIVVQGTVAAHARCSDATLLTLHHVAFGDVVCPHCLQRHRGARAECDAHVERRLISARQPRATTQRRSVLRRRGRSEGEAKTVRGAPAIALPDEAGSAEVQNLSWRCQQEPHQMRRLSPQQKVATDICSARRVTAGQRSFWPPMGRLNPATSISTCGKQHPMADSRAPADPAQPPFI